MYNPKKEPGAKGQGLRDDKRSWGWRKAVRGIPGPFVFTPPNMDEEEGLLWKRANEGADPIPDWIPEQTIIDRVPASRFNRAEDAMDYFLARHGRVLQNLSDCRWWAARVYRTR